MKCTYSQEERIRLITLYLGGELDLSERARWEKHLSSCITCREELSNLKNILQNIQRNCVCRDLSLYESDQILRFIQVKSKKASSWSIDIIPTFALKFTIYALIVTVMIMIGFFTKDFLWYDSIGEKKEFSISQEDEEIIKNLDLLKELETIEKLVQIVDSLQEENHS